MEGGEVHGGKFMMEEGRFMLEGVGSFWRREIHIEGGEVRVGGAEVHVGGGRGSLGKVYDGGGDFHIEEGRGS